MTQQNASVVQAGDRDPHVRVRRRHVVVMIIPRQYGNIAIRPDRQRVHVRIAANAVGDHRLHAHGCAALDLHPRSAHHLRHAKQIEYRLIDPVRRQCPEAVEVRLILKFKRPGQHSRDVGLRPIRQLENVFHHRRGVRRVQRAVAIRILRIYPGRARRASFRIRFAQHDRQILKLRKFADNLKTLVHVVGIFRNPHPHMPVHHRRPALGVVSNEIERCVVLGTMF